jgi:hypothetical protein
MQAKSTAARKFPMKTEENPEIDNPQSKSTARNKHLAPAATSA